MPEWLLWAVAILAAVAAGWAWSSWRHRVGQRPARRPQRKPGRSRPGRSGTRAAPGRTTAPPRPRRERDRPRAGSSPAAGPAPGEIWWADVPFEDGTGSKDRPCLVLRADRSGAEVLKITSQDRSDRDDHLPIPTREWDPEADRDSFLDLVTPIRVDAAAFRSRAGRVDPQVWRRVRTLHRLPAR